MRDHKTRQDRSQNKTKEITNQDHSSSLPDPGGGGGCGGGQIQIINETFRRANMIRKNVGGRL